MKNALPRTPIFVTKNRAPTGGLSHQTSLLNVVALIHCVKE